MAFYQQISPVTVEAKQFRSIDDYESLRDWAACYGKDIWLDVYHGEHRICFNDQYNGKSLRMGIGHWLVRMKSGTEEVFLACSNEFFQKTYARLGE